MKNFGFTQEEKDQLANQKLDLEDELEGINDAIDEMVNESLPGLLEKEHLYKKFYEGYSNCIYNLDALIVYSQGNQHLRAYDYPGDAAYPNAGYEIQKAADFNSKSFLFPDTWMYMYPNSTDEGYGNEVLGRYDHSEYYLGILEATMIEDAIADCQRTHPGSSSIICNNLTVGILNLPDQKVAIEKQLSYIPAIKSYFESLEVLWIVESLLDDWETKCNEAIEYINRILRDPYSFRITTRRNRIRERQAELDAFYNTIKGKTEIDQYIFAYRYSWLNNRVNRAYGSLTGIYTTYNSINIMNDRKTMIEFIIGEINGQLV